MAKPQKQFVLLWGERGASMGWLSIAPAANTAALSCQALFL